MVDATGKIVFLNKQAERLFGYAAKEVLGEDIEILMPAAVRHAHAAHRQGYEGSPHRRPLISGLSLQGLRKDGNAFDAEIALTPIQTDQGLIVSSTVRERRGDAMTDAYFKNLLESAPDAMIIVSDTGKIEIVNGQTEQMFGYTRSELLGKPIEMLLPARYRGRHEDHRVQFLKDPHVRPMGAGMELSALRKDGTEFPVEISLSSVAPAHGDDWLQRHPRCHGTQTPGGGTDRGAARGRAGEQGKHGVPRCRQSRPAPAGAGAEPVERCIAPDGQTTARARDGGKPAALARCNDQPAEFAARHQSAGCRRYRTGVRSVLDSAPVRSPIGGVCPPGKSEGPALPPARLSPDCAQRSKPAGRNCPEPRVQCHSLYRQGRSGVVLRAGGQSIAHGRQGHWYRHRGRSTRRDFPGVSPVQGPGRQFRRIWSRPGDRPATRRSAGHPRHGGIDTGQRFLLFRLPAAGQESGIWMPTSSRPARRYGMPMPAA